MPGVNIDSPALTGLYLEKLVQVGEDEGVGIAQILARLNLSRDDFCRPETRFTYRQFYSLVEALEDQGRVAGVGFKLGRKEGPLTEGFLGYACTSAANLRQSIQTYIRFAGDMGLDINVSLGIEGEKAVLAFTEQYPLGRFLRFSIEELVGHLLRLGEQMRGGALKCKAAHLTYASPDHAFMYTDILRCAVKFNQPKNQLFFERHDLDVPFLTANETIYRICVSHCETIYRRQAKSGQLANEIARIIFSMPASPPRFDAIAKQFNMTRRTLRRHLNAEKTSFQEILYDVRMRLAAEYLTKTAASPREISFWIGYQEVASFYRNFKRWSAMTPKEYRDRPAHSE